MLKTTLWRPDTCGCEIEYQWDTNEPEETRVHTLSRIKAKCQDHSSSTDQEVHDSVSKENKHKNKVLAAIMEEVDSIGETFIDDDGKSSRRFKKGLEPKWEFNAQRKLKIKPIQGDNHEKVTIDKIVKDKKTELGII